MHRFIFLILTASILVAAPKAWAVGVEVIEGPVSINQGQGYQPVVDWSPAAPGDLVMAGPTGAGRIVYSPNCVVEVKPGAVVAVQERAPCVTGGGFRPVYLIGGVAVAGAVVGIIALTGGDGGGGKDKLLDDDDDPASP